MLNNYKYFVNPSARLWHNNDDEKFNVHLLENGFYEVSRIEFWIHKIPALWRELNKRYQSPAIDESSRFNVVFQLDEGGYMAILQTWKVQQSAGVFERNYYETSLTFSRGGIPIPDGEWIEYCDKRGTGSPTIFMDGLKERIEKIRGDNWQPENGWPDWVIKDE